MANMPENPDMPEDVGVRPTPTGPDSMVGVSGTAIYGGYIVEQEQDSKLTRDQRYKTYSEMMNDIGIINAGVRFFTNLLGRAQWKFMPAEGDGLDEGMAEQIAEAVHYALHNCDTPWHRIVRRMSMYRFYGFSVQEWTAEEREGKICFADIQPRAQRTIEKFHTNQRGEVFGFIQESPHDYKQLYIPRWKTVYAVDDTLNDSPEGYGLFRGLYRPATQLREYLQLESYGFQTDLRGIPKGSAPLSQLQQMVDEGRITEAQMQSILNPMKTFIQSHKRNPQLGMLLDSMPYHAAGDNQAPSSTPQWNLELLKGSSQSHQDIARAITRLNSEMARMLGVENVLLGESGNGSHALSQDKSLNFGLVVDSTIRELREVVKRDLITPLFVMNGWDMKYMPMVTTDAIQHRDITTITQSLAQMAQAGAPIMPDDPVVDEVRDLLGLSHSTIGDYPIEDLPGMTDPITPTPADAEDSDTNA